MTNPFIAIGILIVLYVMCAHPGVFFGTLLATMLALIALNTWGLGPTVMIIIGCCLLHAAVARPKKEDK
jgi:hypothetical protein